MQHIPKEFRKGIRSVWLIFRGKDFCNESRPQNIQKLSTNPDEWQSCIDKLIVKRSHIDLRGRIYSDLNARNINRAIREFKRRQFENDYQQDVSKFYLSIEKNWLSCLEHKKSADTNYFLLDLDTPETYEETKQYIAKVNPKLLVFDYPTSAGGHIITHPHNYTREPYRAYVKINALLRVL